MSYTCTQALLRASEGFSGLWLSDAGLSVTTAPMFIEHVRDGLCWADVMGWRGPDANRALAVRKAGSAGVFLLTHWDEVVPTGQWEVRITVPLSQTVRSPLVPLEVDAAKLGFKLSPEELSS